MFALDGLRAGAWKSSQSSSSGGIFKGKTRLSEVRVPWTPAASGCGLRRGRFSPAASMLPASCREGALRHNPGMRPKFNIDVGIIAVLAACYGLGQFVSPYRLSTLAAVLVAILFVRLIRSGIVWLFGGR